MNNNNNKIIPILPVYLQKQIIKILCEFINEKNRVIEPITIDLDYRSHESIIKKLTMKLSLVCKLWFKTVSENLYVSVDFNFSDSEYSINKRENMQILKLHFNHPSNYYYKMIRGVETPIENQEISDTIKTMNQLESLIFRNININGSESHELNFLDLIDCNSISRPGGLEVLEVEIHSDTDQLKLDHLKSTVSKVFSLIINNCQSKEIIIDTLKHWNQSIHQFYVVSHSSSIPPFPWKSLSLSGYLSNIQYYEIYGIDLRLSTLSTLLKSSRNLKHFSFSICLDKFIYFLNKILNIDDINNIDSNNNNNNNHNKIKKNKRYDMVEKLIMKQINQVRRNKKSNNQGNKDEDDSDSDSDSDESDDMDIDDSDESDDDDNNNNDDCNKIIKCTCHSLIFSKTNINYYNNSEFNDSMEDEKPNQEGIEEDEDEAKEIRVFRNEWLHFRSIIENHNSLESLHIGQECKENGEVMEFSQRKQRSIKLSNAFVKEFGSMISSIAPLRKLSILGLNSDQLIRYISSINKKITKYFHVESIMDDGSYAHDDTPTIQSILVDNPQITDLKHTKFVFTVQKQLFNDLYNGNEPFNTNVLNDLLSFKENVIFLYKK
ncbi:hypothetical protein DDB_G0276929 [Dictyostelium discoideum AX4]|uniref:F-box domain-containing protein n=1 Tax=Dictyostelium discoideum TaxID=44689 RepID=Q86KQ5_DICDI|nr:hypothetical protein DDB_G0276929 [Dictyostelium discoideum AX4]EAL68966.1 hypothetical protein DDB_G0276929 [Dictyostelium discoideum AX4]|eukprot:XP_642814.1 hypothetical protein DDB_G0276929 [Dictyostelium discoideum AX4]